MKPVFQALTSIVVFDFAPECADIEFFILINYFDGIFAKTVSVRHGWFGIFDAHVTNVTHLSAFATILSKSADLACASVAIDWRSSCVPCGVRALNDWHF